MKWSGQNVLCRGPLNKLIKTLSGRRRQCNVSTPVIRKDAVDFLWYLINVLLQIKITIYNKHELVVESNFYAWPTTDTSKLTPEVNTHK